MVHSSALGGGNTGIGVWLETDDVSGLDHYVGNGFASFSFNVRVPRNCYSLILFALDILSIQLSCSHGRPSRQIHIFRIAYCV